MWEPHRVAAYATVAVVVAAAVASGPLVGAVDFTRAPADDPDPAVGEGSADVTVTSLPGRAILDRGEYGAAAYQLRVPDARIELSNVTGQPMIVYKIRLPALGYSRGTVHFVTADRAGALALALEPDSLSPGSVDRDRYEGTLTVLVRGDDERVVRRKPVVVDVRE